MKKVLLLTLGVTAFVFSQAQSFLHGVGTGAIVTSSKNVENSVMFTLMYSPRYTITESDASSISVGIPLAIGFGGSAEYNSQSGTTSSLTYAVNAPLMINYNVGAGSSKESADRFGFFLGAGFGAHLGSSYVLKSVDGGDDYYYDEYVKENQTTFGPAANAGVRFAVGAGTHNIEIMGSFMKGINEGKANIFGIHGVFNF
ncbi:outer membrane beta-barrel protein [Flavihumibacter petaseus]|uniref:Outer membrane protein beta-barrel domain-containing protein n=1 Tax=Flavihumibacter petaseus NBRC 106054 TaxID=1220578 RepID=A0A0E9MUB9_9BACT|nr:outer membrane beta-barrel protein [Flavihumibacter petaseus]GAO41073.1 hypothetical protein FPE01S_01_00850 [Flavihumibacter petaseus NBRC 106054]